MINTELTVVIMSWKRPTNVRRLVAQYFNMSRVSKILVFNNNPDVKLNDLAFERNGRIAVLDATENFGVTPRIAAAGLVRTPYILYVDDDIEFPENTVTRLHDEYMRNNVGAVGIFGRRPSNGIYNVGTHHGRVEILLTRAMVIRTAIAVKAMLPVMEMAQALGGTPFGNGEDIVLSYMAMRERQNRLNLAFNLNYNNISHDDQYAISVTFAGHEAHRTRVVNWCRETFNSSPVSR